MNRGSKCAWLLFLLAAAFSFNYAAHVHGAKRTYKRQMRNHTHVYGQRYAENGHKHSYLESNVKRGASKIEESFLEHNRNNRQESTTKVLKTTISTRTCPLSSKVAYKSQSNEDRAMYELFYKSPPKCGGTIVEIGALDGLTYSNSYFFEMALGWRSLLVEANPINFAKLQRNRPDALTVHAAMCSQKNVIFKGRNAVGGIVSEMSENHAKKWIKSSDPVVEVPCRHWHELFSKFEILHIDIFVIDVEGGELSVLSVMDWAVSVDYFIIENNERSSEVVDLLANKGYFPVSWNLKKWCTPGHDCTSNTVFTKLDPL